MTLVPTLIEQDHPGSACNLAKVTILKCYNVIILQIFIFVMLQCWPIFSKNK